MSRKNSNFFQTDNLNNLYNYINETFSKFETTKFNISEKQLSDDDILKINNLIKTVLSNGDLLNYGILMLSFLELLNNKLLNLKKNVIAHNSNEQKQAKEIELANGWVKTIDSNIKYLHKLIMKQANFGGKVKRLLEKKEISRHQLAALLNTSYTNVCAYCNNKYIPDIYKLLQLSALLDCKVEYLIDPAINIDDLKSDNNYKNIGLSDASIDKLTEIQTSNKCNKINIVLDILIQNLNIDDKSDNDILSSIVEYLDKANSQYSKSVSQNTLDLYKEKFNSINNVEDAKLLFNEFNNTIIEENNKSLSNPDILLLHNIQQAIIKTKEILQDEL